MSEATYQDRSKHSDSDLIGQLCVALGDACVMYGEALQTYAVADWSDSPAGVPKALLLPRSTEHVVSAVQLCARHNVALAIQGGLTGLAGGGNARSGEVALSLSRMDSIEHFDAVGGTAIVQAGITLEQLQATLAEQHWFFPLDLGARGSCQLGGNAATNAGGNMVVRYGMMRQSILGLEVVLADGTVLSMLDQMIKNNAGYDLKQLFIGTEGTLGIITRLSLKLEPLRPTRSVALCALADFDCSANLLRLARTGLPNLAAFELMWQDFMEAAAAVLQRSLPFNSPHPLYVLLEAHGNEPDACDANLQAVLATALEQGLVEDVIISQSLEQTARLWEYREAVSELLPATRPHIAFDVSAGLMSLNGIVASLGLWLKSNYPACQHLFFGHLGDGNLHLISGPYTDASDLTKVNQKVYSCIGEYGGSVSAEHGIGLAKKPYLGFSRKPEEITLMKKLKRLLDPQGTLNPERILDPD